MRLRKSTAVLISVWVAAFVLYVFVKPTTPDHAGFAPIADTIPKSVVSSHSSE
ncbi:hypothetical protein BJY24_000901 [Nocardia transvalensis]|uniref:Uncharacterized protein n=1 Tax=Nocardia transvalensis TaxID=37333 RepID=A0A7W9UG95_9NOCA|nr:hypothetical protein [Nocardia transvalensis]MBB5912034.1 hypothetical protein [Nocardia transvalensis]